MHRSLSFAMQRVCSKTKRSHRATSRVAAFPLIHHELRRIVDSR